MEIFFKFLLCIENPTGFPLRVGGLPVGFFRFEMSAHKPFLFVGTHFKTGWDSKGMAIPLALGYPIGARAPCWLMDPKGTAVSPAGSVGASKCHRHFEVSTEHADFGAPCAGIQDLPRGKIRLFGCRGCSVMERRSKAEPWNGAASLGEQKVYQTRRSDASRHPTSNGTVACSGSLSLKHRNKYRIASYA